jgi:hypothetical protein
MESIILASVMGWALERTNIIMNAMIPPSIQNENAGFGAVDGTITRTTLAPACYRVLVPWLIWIYRKLFPNANPDSDLLVYQAIRTVLMIFMFWSLMQGWSPLVAAVTGVILVATIRFDYWDWPVEVIGIALAMSGNLPLAITGAILASLSRETAPLLVIVYFARTGDWIDSLWLAGMIAAIMLGVRLFVGRRALHCPRFVWRINLNALLNIFKWKPVWNADIFITVVLTILGILVVFTFPPGWVIIPVILVLSWTMAKFDEARTLASIIPFIAAYLVRGL